MSTTTRPLFFKALVLAGLVAAPVRGQGQSRTGRWAVEEQEAAFILELARQVHPNGLALKEGVPGEGDIPAISRRSVKVSLSGLAPPPAAGMEERMAEAGTEWALIESEDLARRGQWADAVARLESLAGRHLPKRLRDKIGGRLARYRRQQAGEKD